MQLFVSLALCTLALPFTQAGPVARQAGCSDVTIVFARGTTETPPIGDILGPPFETALGVALPGQSIDFQGVDYPADFPGFFLGGDPEGSREMARQVTQVAADCPNTKIVMSGYSQGAQLVHNAAEIMSATVATRVGAVVMFGDPKNGQSLANGLDNRSITFCNFGDLICQGQAIVLLPHLQYGQHVDDAAEFVASKL